MVANIWKETKESEERRKKPKAAEWSAASRKLIKVSVKEAPHGKDDIRFLIDGKDVRERFLESRRSDQKLRSMFDEKFKDGADGIEKGVVWPHSISLGNEDWEKQWEQASKKYKKWDVTETERRARLDWAYKQEEFKKFCEQIQAHIDERRLTKE